MSNPQPLHRETASEIQKNFLLKKLGKKAHEIVRTKEEVYSQLELAVDSTEEEIIAAIIKYPVLLERPIVVKGDRAVIGRPPENIKTLF